MVSFKQFAKPTNQKNMLESYTPILMGDKKGWETSLLNVYWWKAMENGIEAWVPKKWQL